MRAACLIACAALVAAAGPIAPAGASAVARSGSCPARDAGAAAGHPPVSTRADANVKLVPPGAVSVLLCHYSGLTEPAPLSIPAPEFTLWAHRLITTPATAAALAAALDAIRPTPPGVAISCPADFEQYVVAYFGYANGPPDPVTIGVNGCDTVTNGLIHRLGLSGRGVSRVIALVPAPRPALVRVELRLCGGPAPGGCRISAFGDCGATHGSCVYADRATIVAADGAAVATLRLHDGRSGQLALIPARYTVRLLGDGPDTRGRVLQTRQATLSAGSDPAITFTIAVP